MLDNPRDRQSYPLDKDFKIGDLTFDIVGRFIDTSDTTYIMGQQILGFSLGEEVSLQENVYINITAVPTTIDSDRGVYRYTIAAAADRGLDSDNTDSTDLDSQTSNQKKHPAGRQVGIVISSVYQAELSKLFDAGSVTNEETTGEEIDASSSPISVSLHTDGKLYKYHATNYPGLVGIVGDGASHAISTEVEYTTFGGLSTGHTGLTIGTTYYAENTGAITTTSSVTTKYLGVAETALAIRVAPSTPSSLVKASQAEAEAGTENTKFTTPLRVFQGIAAFFIATADFLTNVFRIQDNTDATKEIAFDASGISASTTRTITMPDNNVDLGNLNPAKISFSTLFETSTRFGTGGNGGSETFDGSGLTINTGTVSTKYNSVFINKANAAYNFGNGNVMFSLQVTPSGFVATNGERLFVGLSDEDAGNGISISSGVDGFGFIFQNIFGTLNLYAYNGDGSASGTTALISTFTNATPYHLVAVRDGTTSIKFYVNGVLSSTSTTKIPTVDLTYAPFFTVFNVGTNDIQAIIDYFSIERF